MKTRKSQCVLCLSHKIKTKSGKRKKERGKDISFFHGVIIKRLITFLFVLEKRKCEDK